MDMGSFHYEPFRKSLTYTGLNKWFIIRG